MQPKQLMAIAGFILILAGVGLIIAQVIWPLHFEGMEKELGWTGFSMKTKVVGYGVLLVGAILMALTVIKVPRISFESDKKD